jgi:hypothetical protein
MTKNEQLFLVCIKVISGCNCVVCFVSSQANGESWKRIEAILLYVAADIAGNFLVNKGPHIGMGCSWGCT